MTVWRSEKGGQISGGNLRKEERGIYRFGVFDRRLRESAVSFGLRPWFEGDGLAWWGIWERLIGLTRVPSPASWLGACLSILP